MRRPSPSRARLRYGFIAGFFNQTLPSTVGGDAVRIWLLGRDQGGWRVATYSVLIDRMVGVLVLASLVIVCLPWSFALISNTAGRSALLLVGFGSVGACAVFMALGFIHWRWLERWWLTRQLAAAAAMARRVFASASSAAPIIVYSLIIQAMSVSAAWCLAKSVAAPLGLERGAAARSPGAADRDHPAVDCRLGHARDRDDLGLRLCRPAGKRRAHRLGAARHRDLCRRPGRRRYLDPRPRQTAARGRVNRRCDSRDTRR